MIALGGPKLKLALCQNSGDAVISFNDSTGWA